MISDDTPPPGDHDAGPSRVGLGDDERIPRCRRNRPAHPRGHDLRQPRRPIDAGRPWPLRAVTGDGPEAEWGPPEILAHVTEMLPYWLGEIERVVSGSPEPVPFGRVSTDQLRSLTIERDRTLPTRELLGRIDSGVARYARPAAPADGGRLGAGRAPPAPRRDDGRGNARAIRRQPRRGARRSACRRSWGPEAGLRQSDSGPVQPGNSPTRPSSIGTHGSWPIRRLERRIVAGTTFVPR